MLPLSRWVTVFAATLAFAAIGCQEAPVDRSQSDGPSAAQADLGVEPDSALPSSDATPAGQDASPADGSPTADASRPADATPGVDTAPAPPAGKIVFFGLSKSKANDSVSQQQRGFDAVQAVAKALASANITRQQIVQEPVSPDVNAFVVDEQAVRATLASYKTTLGSNDTIIIYSHTHGIQSKSSQQLGGLLVTDPAAFNGKRPNWLDWSEFVDDLLALPAKNVIVLTMACFSGGLVEYLDQPHVKARWQSRQQNGRNFVVITSQNATSLSNPRRINGVLVNPFTHAVENGFSGAADGHGSVAAAKDGRLTLGELVNYLLDETRRHTRDTDTDNDPDPQSTGSYDANVTLIGSITP
jgi:hypothetical protein